MHEYVYRLWWCRRRPELTAHEQLKNISQLGPRSEAYPNAPNPTGDIHQSFCG